VSIVGLDQGDTRAKSRHELLDLGNGRQAGGGRGLDRPITVQVEGVDAAVAPLLEGIGGQGGRKEALDGLGSLRPQPGRAVEAAGTFNRERGQDDFLAKRRWVF
jgi:hypothetical protein